MEMGSQEQGDHFWGPVLLCLNRVREGEMSSLYNQSILKYLLENTPVCVCMRVCVYAYSTLDYSLLFFTCISHTIYMIT